MSRRTFYLSADDPKQPRIMFTAPSPELAATAYLGRHYPGYSFAELVPWPTKEDASGRIMKWWRAHCHNDQGQHIRLWVREQVGGFDAPPLTARAFAGFH